MPYLYRPFIGLVAFAVSTPALAATPESWAKLDKEVETACLKAAKLSTAKAGPPMRYSDRLGIEARIVEGVWPQPHMKGAKAKMLCLYNRKNKRVEVQEIATPPASAIPVKDVVWRAEAIGGSGIVDGSEVTMMLGSDSKIGGRSGCNGYSANYQITGDAIKILSPIIGTRMGCAPALMYQERAYLKLVEGAVSVAAQTDGALVMTSADGNTVRFVRK